MSIVSVRKVAAYDAALLDAAVEAHFDVLGLTRLIRPDMRVVIKPNLLAARKPECTATTHPAVVSAIIRRLRALGVEHIVIADSPGGPYVAANLLTVYSSCGYKSLEGEAELNYNTDWREREAPKGSSIKRFNIIEPICDADLIINVPKLKTHSLTGMSGGIKNLFGCIPGLQKPEMHYRCPDIAAFSAMLLDLALTVRPAVTILDAISAMEGNGPNMGTPRFCGYLLASCDLFTQDAVAASLMGIDPERVEMLRQARERGLISAAELVGDSIDPQNFLPPDSDEDNYLTGIPDFMRGPVGVLARQFLKPVPHIMRERCVGCGKCAESCPQHIIELRERKAVIGEKRKCISCFCCQEMCPAHAITVRRRLRQGARKEIEG